MRLQQDCHNPERAFALDFKDSPPPRDLVIAMCFVLFLIYRNTFLAFNRPLIQFLITGPKYFDVMSKVAQIPFI